MSLKGPIRRGFFEQPVVKMVGSAPVAVRRKWNER